MNPSSPPIVRPRNWLVPVLLFIFVLGLLLLGSVVYGITSYLRLGSDERALRNGLLKAADAPWERKLEINVGSWTVAVARTGLLFVHLPREAQQAIQCVRAGEVGIYQFVDHAPGLNRPALLAAGDRVMDGRGWDRLVGVVDRDDFVAVYVPKKQVSAKNLKVCVAVIDEGQLVVVSARGDVEPIMDLVREKAGWRFDHGEIRSNFFTAEVLRR